MTLKRGTEIETRMGPDPRWGFQAPVPEVTTTATPGGLERRVTVERTVSPDDLDHLLEIERFDEEIRVNNRTYVRTYDAEENRWTSVTPEGREQSIFMDEKGRVVETVRGNLHPVRFSYLPEGLM
jgi:hypothetical protein